MDLNETDYYIYKNIYKSFKYFGECGKKEDVGSIAGICCTMCGISYME